MTAAQLRSEIFKKIERLNASSLHELYRVLMNYFNSKQSVEEWAASMSQPEIDAIEEGLEQLNKGQRIPRTEAMSRLWKQKPLHETCNIFSSPFPLLREICNRGALIPFQ